MPPTNFVEAWAPSERPKSSRIIRELEQRLASDDHATAVSLEREVALSIEVLRTNLADFIEQSGAKSPTARQPGYRGTVFNHERFGAATVRKRFLAFSSPSFRLRYELL